ncbi:MAG: aldo/keto reductase [Pseudomonadota bacterium]
MQQRQLGRDGPQISALGIGAMSFSDFFGPVNEADSQAVLRAALDLGVNHIDTANIYGMGVSEQLIGRFLRDNPGSRDQFVIATKAGITRDDDGRRIYRNDQAHLEAELDASLARLGVDAVDLFYIHRRQADMKIEEVTGALATLVAKGKTRAIGFSEIAPTSLRRAMAVHPVAAVQSEYSLSTRAPELGLVQTCAELGVALVAFSPVGRGLLTDHPPTLERVADIPFLAGNPRFMPDALERNIAAMAGLRRVAEEAGLSIATLAIGWLVAQGEHVLPIPGTRSEAHFRALVQGATQPLAADVLDAIEAALPLGWCHGDRYNEAQWVGPERYC